MIHHETTNGMLNNINEIGQLAKKYNKTFIVDAMSSFAGEDLDMIKDNIDFCMSSAQKGLAAYTGVSWVVGNIEEIKKSKNYPTRSYYCNLFMQYDFFERNGESHFTPPPQIICALKQAIKEYWEEGEQARYERLSICWEAICKGLEETGLDQVIDKDIQSKFVVTIKAPKDDKFDFDKLHDYC